MRRSALMAAAVVIPFVTAGIALPAEAATKPIPKFKNCAAMNKIYKHGIGKKGAKDKVAKGRKPVTNFLVSNQGYTANYKLLDRDRDGIACEKL